LVYSDAPHPNYLAEYAQHYDTVEVDQWFWSLFAPDRVVLPQPNVVTEYAAAVPKEFRFAVKLPNALTLTHFHQAARTDPLVPNPHFLSLDVLHGFLDRLAPMRDKLGPLMLQFGYLSVDTMVMKMTVAATTSISEIARATRTTLPDFPWLSHHFRYFDSK